MKKFSTLLLLLSVNLLGISYQSRVVEQNWQFKTRESLEQLNVISGKWEIVTPDKLNQPFLSQSIKYADFPKTLIKDKDFFDFEAATKVYISSENEEVQSAGLILRYRNLYSFYMLFLNTKDKRLTLTKASRGGLKVLERVEKEFIPDRWYELRAACYLDRIRAFVDGQMILEAEDKTTTGGKIGLVTAGTTRAYFDGLQVKSESIEMVK